MSKNNLIKAGLINSPELPDSVDNAIKNLTDAPTQNAGKTLADLWYLIFGGISLKADKVRLKYAADLEKYNQELKQTTNEIPKEKLAEPSIQVIAQALENSKYCISSALLRKMFVNLISSSMNIDTKDFVHPSFPEIIKQLSTFDATLLVDIYCSNQQPLPVASLGINTPQQGHTVLFNNIYISKTLNFSTDMCSLSLASLQRANLISISYVQRLSDDEMYNSLRETSEYIDVQKMASLSHGSLYFRKGIVQLTDFGNKFCSICIKTD